MHYSEQSGLRPGENLFYHVGTRLSGVADHLAQDAVSVWPIWGTQAPKPTNLGSLPRRGKRTKPGVLTPGTPKKTPRPEGAAEHVSAPNVSLVKTYAVFLKECADFLLECHFPVMDFLVHDISDDGALV